MAPFPSFTKTWHTSPTATISPTRPELSLAGKTAVISGGGLGIGLAISTALVEAGISKLAILGRRVDVLNAAKANLLSKAGDKTEILIVSADISNHEQVTSAFETIKNQFKQPLDLLISNAGYLGSPQPVGKETDEEWTRAMNVNIKGVYFLASAFVANAASDAIIINVSSSIAHIGAFPGFTSYAATKLAGSKVMEYVQQENPKMRVVDMHPGQVRETEMAEKASARNHIGHVDDGEYNLYAVGMMIETILIEISVAELAAHFAVWLASPEASFLKGKYTWCNWDVDELKASAKEIESSSVLTIGLNDFARY